MKTAKELQDIKKDLDSKHTKVYTIEIPLSDDDDETTFKTIFLKKFDRVTLSIVQKLAQGNDPLKAVEVFIKNTYLGGDDLNAVLADFEALRRLEGVVVQLIHTKTATLKKN
jgi:hypothetical protein